MTTEKLTAKKVLLIMTLTVLSVLAYFGILIFSLPFTGNMMTSLILALSFATTVILFCIVTALRKKWRAQN
jgi:hypothetical protein